MLAMIRSVFLHASLVTLLLAVNLSAAQQPAWQPAPGHVTLDLWPHGAPDAQPSAGPEADMTTPKDHVIAGRPVLRLGNVSNPAITLYQAKDNPSGTAVVVFPGGAYRILAIDLEGTEVCDWLNSINVTCVLLKYRVPNTGPYPKSPAALQDAQRALGMVRAHAAEWHIDPHRIGVLGFSAGGHLSAALSTHFDQRLYAQVDSADQQSCRPDFAVIIYPGYLALAEQNFAPNPEIHVTDQTPPTFLLQAEDDPVHVENVLVYFQLLKNAKVPAELHIYTEGGHGYGLRRTEKPVTHWPDLVETWLKTIGMTTLKFQIGVMGELIDKSGTEAGFRTRLFPQEVHLGFKDLRAPDGENLTMQDGEFRNADEATRYLEWNIKQRAAKVIVQESNPGVETVGYRAVFLSKSDEKNVFTDVCSDMD